VGAAEYKADDRLFWIWEKCRDRTMRERGTLDALQIKQLLDVTDSQPGRPWTLDEVRKGIESWRRDKGEE
jgi:hypothetical protein